MLANLKGEIDSNTIIFEEFNTLFVPMERYSKENIKKEKLALNNTLDQMDSTDGLMEIYEIYERERDFMQKQQNTHSFQVHVE